MSDDTYLELKIGAYDQVIAISQGAINYNLQRRAKIRSWAAKLDKQFADLACSIKGSLELPTVELDDTPARDRVRFMLKLTAGSTFTFKDAAGAATTADVGGSRLVFELPLYLDEMNDMDATLRAQLLEPGSYTVSQMAIDFGNADMANFNRVESVINGFSAQSPGKDKFILAITQHILELARADKSATGLALTAVKPTIVTKTQASYPPVAVRLQAIAYRPGGTGRPHPSHQENAFLFTEVCANAAKADKVRRLPDPPHAELPWTGNWIVPPFNGAFVLSKRVYFDTHLRPLFHRLDIRIAKRIDKAMKHAVNPMTQRSHAEGLENSASLIPDPHYYEPRGHYMYDANGDRLHFESQWTRAHYPYGPQYRRLFESSCAVFGYVTIEPRTNTISFKHYATYRGKTSGEQPGNTDDTMTIEVRYLFKLQFTSVAGAKLQINVIDKTLEKVSIEFVSYLGSTRGLSATIHNPELAHDLNKLTDDFGTKLAQEAPLTLPGGTTFLFKDPVFLNNCDLYVKLSIDTRGRDDQDTIDVVEGQGQ